LDKLLLSFAALALGPLLVALARRHAWSMVLIDSFCVIAVSGFAVLHLLPECAASVGWSVIPLALVGFLAPTLAERGLHRSSAQIHRFVLVLALLGVAAHSILDGVFLHAGAHGHDHAHEHAHSHAHTHSTTAWAIILHRIPEGIGIWWIVPRTLGWPATLLVLAVSVSSTIAGFFLSHDIEAISTSGLSMLQALLAGSLLHVVLHAHIPAPRDRQRWHFSSVAGAALAATVLWFVIHDHFPSSEHGSPLQIFLTLAIESAPALLAAYLLVGLCHAFMPQGWFARMTRGRPFTQALRGVAVGLPLPVCSCGVVPIYRQLVRQGASMAAALAFLVATPELEIAAVLLTIKLMGFEMAVVRVVMAVLIALGVGMLVHRLVGTQQPIEQDGALPEEVTGTFGQRLATAIRFGYGPAVDHTATWILTGLLLSALLTPYVDKEWLASLPNGIDVPIAALIGLPLYVCATGSTPLAAMLLVLGMSPGAVLALLLTGPATNVTTFGVLKRLHGSRAATLFAASMLVGTIVLGHLVNWLLPTLAISPTVPLEHEHATGSWVWLWLLAGLFGLSLLRQGVRPCVERLFESPANAGEGDGSGGCCAHGDADDHHAADAEASRHDHGHQHGHRHGSDADPHGPDCCH
jgi:uncharacterized membrane protein YraQ (UPF0718 family)